MTTKSYLKKNMKSISGKTIAISGATGGLGSSICHILAANGANIILIDRNNEKQAALITTLKQKYPSATFDGLLADMEDINSVKRLAETLSEQPLHALILNAGAYSIPRHKTNIGYDNVFTINFISPYYLTKALLPHIKENNGRIIAVGSIAHNYSKIDENDIDFGHKRKSSLVYGNSKRYLMYSLSSLANESEPIIISHPGISFTGITAHYPKLIFAIIKYPMKLIFMKPKCACLSIVQGLFTTPKPFYWLGPRYFSIWGLPKISKLSSANEREILFIKNTAEKIYNNLNAN